MANAYFLAGNAANGVLHAASVAVTNESSGFSKENLLNGLPRKPFKGSAVATDFTVTFDMNMMDNPSFEDDANGETPTSWEVWSGSPTVSNAEVDTGNGTVSLLLNAANEGVYQDHLLVRGKTYRLECDLYGDANGISVYIIDTETGKYWKEDDETWTATKTATFTRTATSWNSETDRFTLEAPSTRGPGFVKVRVLVQKSGTGTAYADVFALYPYVTWVSVHDFNHHDSIDLQVRSSTDNFSGDDTDESDANFSAVRNNIYAAFTPQNVAPRRYWRLSFIGDLLDPLRIGQVWLGEHTALAKLPSLGYEISGTMPQSGRTDGTSAEPRSLLDIAPRTLSMDFGGNASHLAQMVNDFVEASGYGSEPVVLLPDDSRPEELIYGYASNELARSRRGVTKFEYAMQVREAPFIRKLA